MHILDGLDDAILGVVRVHAQPTRVLYDVEKIIEILTERHPESTYEEIIEHIDFNILCLSIEPNTPAFFYPGDLEFVREVDEDGG